MSQTDILDESIDAEAELAIDKYCKNYCLTSEDEKIVEYCEVCLASKIIGNEYICCVHFPKSVYFKDSFYNLPNVSNQQFTQGKIDVVSATTFLNSKNSKTLKKPKIKFPNKDVYTSEIDGCYISIESVQITIETLINFVDVFLNKCRLFVKNKLHLKYLFDNNKNNPDFVRIFFCFPVDKILKYWNLYKREFISYCNESFGEWPYEYLSEAVKNLRSEKSIEYYEYIVLIYTNPKLAMERGPLRFPRQMQVVIPPPSKLFTTDDLIRKFLDDTR